MVNENEVRKIVRKRYGAAARESKSCCGPANKKLTRSSCGCGTGTNELISLAVGYSAEDLEVIPDEANLGLGCGNPVALASLKKGEVVLDLGSGAGMDVFFAASKVGETGKVIGVDMTPDMVERARGIARKEKYSNVEFRLGEIENLPVADNSIDAIISNCVINLSPDKPRVFQEAFRVLKEGGRLMISDMVLLAELPEKVKKSAEAYTACVAGASLKDEYLKFIKEAGFKDVRIVKETSLPVEMLLEDDVVKTLDIPESDLRKAAASVVSIKVQATKK